MSLIPVDPSSEASVTTLLERAASWLSTAVERSDITDIVMVKAQIATAAEATKQLGLSQEIQQDAQEMVRRAEYALAKSIRKGQAEGTIRRQDDGASSQRLSQRESLGRLTDFGTYGEMYGRDGKSGFLSTADAAPEADQFDAAIDAAKAEGNLSRANVARKAREASAEPASSGPERAASNGARRRPLPDSFWTAVYDAEKKLQSLRRLTEDDRWPQNAQKVAETHRHDLLRINDLLHQVINSLPETEVTP
ncbi:hypothetical protein [Nocardioides bruguierae]|uniref:Uncharacterized protein n=1 Tax=Nocardioides bruguierae TaxID=2945102 RepID=A0A9X2D6A4_9ACTN|nr:hypothetical protein [Nocardioides bruguierae]MCM0619819.1 hypothetical protein [Nocardioides bruguierae]